MMESSEFPVAELTGEQLTKIKQFEEELRTATGQEIVLIAYEHDKQ